MHNQLMHNQLMQNRLLNFSFACAGVLALSSCATTSLSDPNGRGHGSDLNLYELTGQSATRQVTEADIAAARSGGGRAGSLPPRGARVLLVQSGAHQPDQELQNAFRPYCQPVLWNGRSESSPQEEDGEKRVAASAGRRLRLVAAQQGCSHVIVIFGEIQSDSRNLPTAAVSWLPVVSSIVPSQHSGTRLLAQAIILETASARYTTVTAAPRESSGITTEDGGDNINSRRALKLKAAAYPDLAEKSFRK